MLPVLSRRWQLKAVLHCISAATEYTPQCRIYLVACCSCSLSFLQLAAASSQSRRVLIHTVSKQFTLGVLQPEILSAHCWIFFSFFLFLLCMLRLSPCGTERQKFCSAADTTPRLWTCGALAVYLPSWWATADILKHCIPCVAIYSVILSSVGASWCYSALACCVWRSNLRLFPPVHCEHAWLRCYKTDYGVCSHLAFISHWAFLLLKVLLMTALQLFVEFLHEWLLFEVFWDSIVTFAFQASIFCFQCCS